MGFREYIKKLHTQEPIGEGTDKRVYADPSRPERVIGVYKTEEEGEGWREMMKEDFYLSKIAHALFPKNFPNAHMATTEPVTIQKQRVYFTPFENKDLETQEFRDLLEQFREAGIGVDGNVENCGYDKEGNILYVDDPYLIYMSKDLLKHAIEVRLSDDESNRALAWLDRLEINETKT